MLLGTSQLVVLLTSPAPKQRTICALGDMSHPHILHPACLAQNLKKALCITGVELIPSGWCLCISRWHDDGHAQTFCLQIDLRPHHSLNSRQMPLLVLICFLSHVFLPPLLSSLPPPTQSLPLLSRPRSQLLTLPFPLPFGIIWTSTGLAVRTALYQGHEPIPMQGCMREGCDCDSVSWLLCSV